MEKETKAVETTTSAAAPEQVTTPVTTNEEDIGARLEKLEAERLKAIEEASNYKLAFLKEKNKRETDPDETEEGRTRRIIREELAEAKLNRLDTEKETLLKKLAQENRELKLANLNKTASPASMGSSNESAPVHDTLITPDQMKAFKAKGWTDKDIERYKKNLSRQMR